MPKIVYRPKFCSFQTKIGQLDRVMEKKERFGKKMCFSFIFLYSVLVLFVGRYPIPLKTAANLIRHALDGYSLFISGCCWLCNVRIPNQRRIFSICYSCIVSAAEPQSCFLRRVFAGFQGGVCGSITVRP